MPRSRTLQITVAMASAAVILTSSGCNKTTLVPARADSGSPARPDVPLAVPDLGSDQPVLAWGDDGIDLPAEVIPQAGPEPGPEAGPETGHDAPLDEGLDLPTAERPEVSVLAEVGGESGSEARPSACMGSPKDPKLLAKLQGGALPSALVVRGDTVFVGRMGAVRSDDPPTGAIVAVSISTSAQTTYPLGGYIPNQLVAAPGSLFYSQGKVIESDPGSWTFDYRDVMRLDLSSGQASAVGGATVEPSVAVWSIVGTAKGDVFWSLLTAPAGQSVLERWDDVTRQPQTILTWDQSLSLLADQDHLYWSGLTSSLHVDFLSMAMTGGPVSLVYESPDASQNLPSLAAVDDERLYYLLPNAPAQGILAMPKRGGVSQTVVPNASPIFLSSKAVDATYLYWVDQSDQYTLRRTPKHGTGPTEIFWTSYARSITDVAMDDCNVYWTASNPHELLFRAK